MKKLILFFILTILNRIPALEYSDINETIPGAFVDNNSGKFQTLHCPPPPSFSEMIAKENNEGKDHADNIEQNWYQKAMENIQNEEYNITYSDELGQYQSPNRANNMRFIYHKDGFTAKTRTNKIALFDVNDRTIKEKDKKYMTIDDWNIQFKIKNEELEITNSELKVSENKAYIENENIRVEYTNNEEGMRQDFIIKNKPACPYSEAEGKLRLNIRAETKLKMIVGSDALMFKDKDGADKMKYSALKCWDKNGKELRAYFDKLQISNYKLQIGEKRNSNSFTIVVNDEDAVYPVTIDPLSTSPDWTAESNQTNAHFGVSVAAAGDVNSDRYGDVIVGAPNYDNGQIDEGRVYIYYGSSTGLSASPNATIEINQANAQYGSSVATAGDVNADGYSDVIVGAPYYDNGENNEGKAYVYYGTSSGLDINPSWTSESNQAEALFGFSVSTAGDVNGDGYSDVIVDAASFDYTQTDEGVAFAFYGSSSGISLTPNWFVGSFQASSGFGSGGVSTAGDINGDGYSDVIVGAPNYDNGQTNEGRAYVYNGSSSGLSVTASWTAESNQDFASFGYSVATAGDVNGDGYSDVIVGSAFYSNGQPQEGRAYVYHGSASGLSASSNWTAESNQNFARFGFSVAPAGDVNGDGYSDVIVGAPYYDNGEDEEGVAFVFQGSSSGLSATAIWTGESNQIGADMGYCVSTAGDVNGDGFSDVIAGAHYYSNGQSGEGRAFAYYGSANGLSISANWFAESNQSNARYGTSVSTAGDVNGDGYNDVIVGAPFYDNGQTDEGRAFVYLGSASGLSASASWTAESNQTDARFGISVSTAGDVNGDGYIDVIVGANTFDNGQLNEGAAFVYYGSSGGLSSSPGWTGESNVADADFGISVSTAGDVNGDGFGDVVVGAGNESKAYVYHGSPSGLSASPNWTFLNDQPSSRFGSSVGTAGDVNGDGYSDVIAGAYDYSNGQTNEGRAYVYYGSALGLSATANWTAESNQNGANFGYSVSTAGDVNGDGYLDVIVGAYQYDNALSDNGRAYVYHGSAAGLPATANWTADGSQSNARFGSSVSTAGDVNGDGYSDVIIGAPNAASIGTAYVYQGSSSGLSSSSNWSASSGQVNSFFGISVSTAGDVNGDGYSDVIAGASNLDNGLTNGGRAFVFYGNSGNGMQSTARQFKPGTNIVVSPGGLMGNNQVRFNLFGKSFYGRTRGGILIEYKQNGTPFSGNPITNSVSSTLVGVGTELGVAGAQLNYDEGGLLNTKEYKWRARIQYDIPRNPYQRFSPWRYLTSYVPKPYGYFKPMTIDTTPPSITYTTLSDTTQLSGVRILPNVVITDANGVEGTSGKRPRVYYKRSSDPNIFNDNTNSTTGWKYAEASGATSPFSFTISYSLLNGSIIPGDSIQYFVTAADIRPFGEVNVSIKSGTFNAQPSSVNLTSYAFPIGGITNKYKLIGNVTVSGAVSGNGDYSNLSGAFNAINSASQSGASISILIRADTQEPAGGAVLNNGVWTSLSIQPSGARTVTGSATAGLPLIDLNGADNVTIDGLNSGGNSLTISNTTVSSTAGTSTIRLQTDATNNKIRNCTILGSASMIAGTAGGNILLGGNSSSTGNDNNVISNCDLGPAGSNLPAMCVSSNGTTSSAALNNSGDTIRNCNIFNYFNAGAASSGVYLSTGSTDMVIKDNKFYQTAARVNALGQHSSVWVSNSSGNNFTISGNTFGYSSSSGTGTYSVTGESNTKFIVISLTIDSISASNVQGNTIQNISFSGSASGTSTQTPFAGIYIGAGLVNIGTTSGNTIGSQTGLSNIVYTSNSASGSDVYGILNVGINSMQCSNNNIGGITASNSGTGNARIYGIRASMSSPLNIFACSNNFIGGTVLNSIRVTSNNSGNVVAGIFDPNPQANITSNTIRNLSNNGGIGTGTTSSVMGIAVNNTRPNQTISQNTIYGLSNADASSAIHIYGIYISGLTGTNLIARNFIHTLTTLSFNAEISGIQTEGGTATYQNNMIRLGLDSSGNSINEGAQINGISETGGTNNYYFNSVYLCGGPITGSANTFAFSSSVTGNTRNYRNNIFFNARTNDGSSGKHYAVSVAGTAPNPSGLTMNHNIYHANGTGGILGLFNGGNVTSLAAWQSAVGQDANSFNSNPVFINPEGSASAVNLHLDSTIITDAEGSGFDIAGVTDDFDGQTRSLLTPVDIGADAGNFLAARVNVSGAISGNGDYPTLSSAFAAINGASQTGVNITVNVISNTTEPAGGAVLNSGTWTSLSIQPSGARTITGATTAGLPLIDLNGGDNVTIDGLNSEGNSLTISNTTVSSTAGTSTIRLQTDATNNKIRNCTILGSSTVAPGTAGGNVLFGGNSSSTGNDNNVISNCNIGPAGSNLPTMCVSSNGTTSTSALNNSGDTISNCNIYDYFNAAAASSGVYFFTGTTDCVVRDNKFYQTASRTQTTSSNHSGIWISNTSGNNFMISGNTIGYSSSSGTGTYSLVAAADTKFIPILLSVGTSAVSNVQGNTIQNISMSGSASGFAVNAPLIGINITAGLANVGNITGNVFGSQTQQGSITFNTTSVSQQSDVVAMYNSGASPWTCSNNIIGGITSSGSGACRILLIRASMSVPGATFTCSNNIVGSSTDHSIQITSSNNSNLMHGILQNGAPFAASITGNVIRNMANNGGIGTNLNSSIVGIGASGTTGNQTISQNSIYNISNDMTSTAVIVTGIYFSGGASGVNLISRNFIHTLIAKSSTGTINGIHTEGGTVTYQNNMIRLGLDTGGNSINTGFSIKGISETGGTNNFYFNSVYVGGSPTGGTSNTFAFSSSVTGNTRNYRDNIFHNARTNSGSTGKHYAVNVAGTAPNPSGLTLNNNIYFANGSGGVLGLFSGSDVTSLSAWQTAVGQDANSYSSDPKFINPAGSASNVNLHLDSTVSTAAEGSGFDIVSVTDDFDGQIRSTLTPVDIGADAGNFTPAITNKTLNLTMFIQGFYDANSNAMVRDTLRVYLRNASSPYAIVDSAKQYLSSAGSGTFTFSNASNAVPYYIQLKHRNSLVTWSKTTQTFTGNSMTYNFTNSAAQAYGDNMIQIDASPVNYAIYNGDVNQDGTIDLVDLSLIDNDTYNFVSGYVVTDVNGDDFIDLIDLSIADNNAYNFVSAVTPPVLAGFINKQENRKNGSK